MSYVIAFDEGTSSCRAMIFDDRGAVRGVAQKEFRQYFPKPGWVEHDAREIWLAQVAVARDALDQAGLRPQELSAVGITNQRETTVVWDRETGEPVEHALVWQDRRTAEHCEQLKRDGQEALITGKTGLVLDAYFSATKIAWILDHCPGARQRAEAGRLAFGTIDSWLVWNLTSGRRHVTDATNASRTLLFNIHTRNWDDDLLRLFRIPASMLPEVCSSSEVCADISTSHLPGWAGLPIAGIAGDQQAALFGQLCIQRGETKTTYGTGCFMLQHTGPTPVASRHRLLTTMSAESAGEVGYALEGSVFIGGAVVQWLRDGLGIISSSRDVTALASSVSDSGGVCLVPAFAGLGAPYWDSAARGLMVGLTRGTTRAHIARAALEAIAHQVADLLEAMHGDSGIELRSMRVDGGAARDDLLMQIQADLLGVPLIRPAITETTALGAAYLAGLAVGLWKSTRNLVEHEQLDRCFEPQGSPVSVARSRERWKRALERSRNWERDDVPC